MLFYGQFFTVFVKIIIVCIFVAICDLVYDVEAVLTVNCLQHLEIFFLNDARKTANCGRHSYFRKYVLMLLAVNTGHIRAAS